jgi:hypothetical protein
MSYHRGSQRATALLQAAKQGSSRNPNLSSSHQPVGNTSSSATDNDGDGAHFSSLSRVARSAAATSVGESAAHLYVDAQPAGPSTVHPRDGATTSTQRLSQSQSNACFPLSQPSRASATEKNEADVLVRPGMQSSSAGFNALLSPATAVASSTATVNVQHLAGGPGLSARPADVSAAFNSLRSQRCSSPNRMRSVSEARKLHALLSPDKSRARGSTLLVGVDPDRRGNNGANNSDGSGRRAPDAASNGGERGLNDSGLSNTNNRCYSLCDGRVTSLASTPDGAYVLAGFSSGAVRLFDLTSTVCSADIEDRFGHLLDRIDSGSSVVLSLIMACGGACWNDNISVTSECAEGGSRTSRFGELPADHTSNIQSVVRSHALAVCHLFVSCLIGSNRLLAIDIRSILAMKKQRGFITSAGLGVQTFVHSDSRVRGLVSVTGVYCKLFTTSKLLTTDDAYRHIASDFEVQQPAYVVSYNLTCGKGFGHVNVWNVVLSASRKFFTGSSDDAEFSYSQSWSLIYTTSISAPSLSFAAFVSVVPSTYVDHIKVWDASTLSSIEPKTAVTVNKKGVMAESYWESEAEKCSTSSLFESVLEAEAVNGGRNLGKGIVDGSDSDVDVDEEHAAVDVDIDIDMDEDSNLLVPPTEGGSASAQRPTNAVEEAGGGACLCHELLVDAAGKDIRLHSVVLSDAVAEDEHTGQAVTTLMLECTGTRTLKGVSRILASSSDGTILYGGLDELAVYKYLPKSDAFDKSKSGGNVKNLTSGAIVACEIFPLQVSSKQPSSQRRTRHLRQIESVTCTPDGGYALVSCSDNCVFLYRYVSYIY